MKLYDTLIIGSGYTALGYALTRGNTLIVEEGESCDTGFSLSQRCFLLPSYEIKNALAKKLYDYYEALGLICDGMTNTGALECGFCAFAIDMGAEILLKCRIINQELASDGTIKVTVISGGGIEYIFTKRIIDMRNQEEKRYLTFLFTTKNQSLDIPALLSALPNSKIEPAFYKSRYALHMELTEDEDINEARIRLYDIWDKTEHTAKLLYTAPTTALESTKSDIPKDSAYRSFIEAFDAGISYASEVIL